MLILFVCENYYPNGGAHDIVATDVELEGLDELVEANKTDGRWHLYDTEKKEIIKEGRYER